MYEQLRKEFHDELIQVDRTWVEARDRQLPMPRYHLSGITYSLRKTRDAVVTATNFIMNKAPNDVVDIQEDGQPVHSSVEFLALKPKYRPLFSTLVLAKARHNLEGRISQVR